MKQILIIIVLIFPLLGFSQFSQIGQDIDGEAFGDQSGYSVSLSADGNRVAVGAQLNDGNGSEAGHVKIYEVVNGSWVQLGSNINGEATLDFSGWSVSLNSDGNCVAIGARYNDGGVFNSGHVRVYQYDNNDWVQLGQDIDGEAVEDQSGYSVSLSANGNRVAIGAPFNDNGGVNAGNVRIFELVNNAWQQLGSSINGEVATDRSGWSISLSDNGNRVAIGARYNAGGSSFAGHVRVFEFNNSGWVQIGQDIDGEAIDDFSGHSVSLNADGSRVIIGAYVNDGNGFGSGHARVFEFDNNNWSQLGQDIDGEAINDWSGWSVSINDIGNRIAIGARYNDGSIANSGHVRIYEFEQGQWDQLGQDIDGEAFFDSQSGYSVSLDGAGNRVAIGSHLNDGVAANAGHVRVYEFNSSPLSNDDFDLETVALYPNPTQDYFILKGLSENIEFVKIYDIHGRLIEDYKSSSRYKVSDFSKGLYFVQIFTDKRKRYSKLIIH
ncbi:FG-GAP repeat protein [Kordia sp. SMS9]|uniref:T9SS type A sorting domain-containing protein n=1 Tax=Kordia sp. SMS9 TaxID=2282170 RepID=UPI000E0D292A|nr:T9SS type A sorting domain-containing protein [Kordia sp. SMS9]AXG69585.1 FG-GAP repeat protein [Kordia sp. SMS9]